MKLAISTDHAGFELLRQIEPFLVGLGHECIDFGPKNFNAMDDYPDYIFPAAKAVASGRCEAGIILGASGQGEAMAANRVKGVRCALFYGGKGAPSDIEVEGNIPKDEFEIVRLTREHNNANMLSLGARFLTLDEAKRALEVWLNTSFSKAERHTRRIEKLDQIRPGIDNLSTPGTDTADAVPPAAIPVIAPDQPAADNKGGTLADKKEEPAKPTPLKQATIDADGTLNVRHED